MEVPNCEKQFVEGAWTERLVEKINAKDLEKKWKSENNDYWLHFLAFQPTIYWIQGTKAKLENYKKNLLSQAKI